MLLPSESLPSGCNRAPESPHLDQGFAHLKLLRDICQMRIGGNKYTCASPVQEKKYKFMYGRRRDLKAPVDHLRLLSMETEEDTSALDTGSLPSIFYKASARGRPSSPASVEKDDTPVSCELTINAGKEKSDVLEERRHGKFASGVKCSLSSDISKQCLKHDMSALRSLNGEHHSDVNTGMNAEDLEDAHAFAKHTSACRLKIHLQYFRSTRQLQITLHTLENLKDTGLDVLVKLALIGDDSKLKITSRRHHIGYERADLNELVYMQPHDGKIRGKQLRVRLCKVSKFFRRLQQIGEAMVSLDDFETSMNTCVWLTLRDGLSIEKNSSDYEVEDVTDNTDAQSSERIVLSNKLAPADLQLLIESSPANRGAMYTT